LTMTPICDANAWVTAVKTLALNILTVWFAGAMHPVNPYADGSDLVTLCVRKVDSIKDSPSAGFEERLSQAKCQLDGDKTVSNRYFCLPEGERTLLRKAFDCIDVLKLARGGIHNFGIKDVLSNVWRLDRIVSCVEPSRSKKHQTLALDPLSRVFLRTELQHIFKCSVDLTDTSSDEDIEEETPPANITATQPEVACRTCGLVFGGPNQERPICCTSLKAECTACGKKSYPSKDARPDCLEGQQSQIWRSTHGRREMKPTWLSQKY
jgi:hypothetical protein